MDKITIEDFSKIEIRIGTVLDAVVPEWSHWVMQLKVDFGEEVGTKTIFSGIMKFYKPEELVGNQFPFVVNLEPKKIGPKKEDGTYNYSEGMMIMAVPKRDEETPPVLFKLSGTVPNGSIVS
jgi:methionine--tRNA ligase beta chain